MAGFWFDLHCVRPANSVANVCCQWRFLYVVSSEMTLKHVRHNLDQTDQLEPAKTMPRVGSIFVQEHTKKVYVKALCEWAFM